MVWPPTVRVVDRGVVELAFEETLTPTDPLPFPDAGETVAQEAPLDAVHEQLAPLAAIPMVPAPPPAPNGPPRVEVLTVTLHDKACWTTVNNVPPMNTEPVLLTVVEFGRTVYPRLPDVLPDPPDVTVIQLGPRTVL